MDNQRNLSIKKRKDEVDIISELPDNLKESILDCLPIKDAVRTSILSPNWRYVWTIRKCLNFDDAFVSLIRNFNGEKYARIIDRILFLHHGPIEHVSLHIPKGVRDDMIDLNAWLLNCSRKGIQELVIDALKNVHRKRKYFLVPNCLFHCQSLRHLKVSCCELKPPPDFGGFFSLVTLYLSGVVISSDSLGTAISRCRLLETFYFNCEFFGGCYGAEPLIINAPNLRSLKFWDLSLGTVALENVPSLSAVFLGRCTQMQVPAERHNLHSLCHLFYSLWKIEKLDFDLTLLELFNGDCPDILPNFLNLNSVILYGGRISKQEDIAFIFCLLRSSPTLKSLHIQINPEWGLVQEEIEVGLEGLEVEGRKTPNNFNSLLSIHIEYRNFWERIEHGYEPMFKFIKILLSSCSVLETLYVAPRWRHQVDAVKLNWVIKLLQFRRLSSNAEIIIDEK